MFVNDEQRGLAEDIAACLVNRGDTIAVAESTTGGLISAALLSVAGASRYYAGGGVLYTLPSRVALAGVDPEQYANYRGTTPEMLGRLAEAMRSRLDATWCIAESGLAGPTGGRFGDAAGKVTVSVAGPSAWNEVFQTGISDRVENMAGFTTIALRYMHSVLKGLD